MKKVSQVRSDRYVIENNEGTLCREYGKTPNGNNFNGSWVFRDEKGNMIDFDKYRHDLFARNGIEEDYGSN